MLTYSRRKKRFKEIGHEEDRMSNLPDVILTHILSFLSTNEAVKTSILSRRWKFVWVSVPTLDLNMVNFDFRTKSFQEDRIVNFLNRVLIGRCMPYLEKVVLRDLFHSHSHFKSWICAAVERNIRELQIWSFTSTEKPLEFPRSLFYCKTLVVLKLALGMILNFSMTTSCFPNLKALELNFVIYKDDDSAAHFLSSCPVLEDLVINRGDTDNLKTLNITSDSLRNLSVIFSEHYDPQKMVIDAPALESICIDDDATEDYVMRNLPSIIKAKLHVSNFGAVSTSFLLSEDYAARLFMLLRGISNVKFLHLSCLSLSSLSDATSYNLPTFHKLTYLEFYAYNNDNNDNGDNSDNVYKSEYNCSWQLVLEFLKSSPLLEVLVFEDFSFSADDSWRPEWSIVPECLHSHLKKIEIFDVFDRENEMKLMGEEDYLAEHEIILENAGYLLKNAKVLEKMTVELGDIGYELLCLPRGSKRCQLEIL